MSWLNKVKAPKMPEVNEAKKETETDPENPERILKELREAIACCCSEHRYREVSNLITELEILLKGEAK